MALLAAGEPDCRFYMQNGRCGFGMSCRFHHSEPVPGSLATPLGQALMQHQLHMALPAGMPMAGLGLPMSNNMGLAVAGMQSMQGLPSFAMHSPVAGVSCLPGPIILL